MSKKIFGLFWTYGMLSICIERHIVANVFIQRLPTFFIFLSHVKVFDVFLKTSKRFFDVFYICGLMMRHC